MQPHPKIRVILFAMEKTRDICSSTLKIVAIVCMTANHAGYIFAGVLPSWTFALCIVVGGAAFPTMAFLITEGYRRTSNVKRYALRLLVFALVSQAPFWFFLGHNLNVLFTLLLGLVILYADEHVANRLAFAGIALACCALSLLCDWPLVGPIAIFAFARLRDQRGGLVGACWVIAACVALPALTAYFTLPVPLYLYEACGAVFGGAVTTLLLPRYQGRRGLSLKYFFYVYYPAHIAALGFLHLALLGTMPALI